MEESQKVYETDEYVDTDGGSGIPDAVPGDPNAPELPALIRVVIQRPGPSCLQQMKAAVRQETLRKDLRKTVQKKKLPSHKVNKGSKMNKKRNYTVYI